MVHADSGHRPRPPGSERSRFCQVLLLEGKLVVRLVDTVVDSKKADYDNMYTIYEAKDGHSYGVLR